MSFLVIPFFFYTKIIKCWKKKKLLKRTDRAVACRFALALVIEPFIDILMILSTVIGSEFCNPAQKTKHKHDLNQANSVPYDHSIHKISLPDG